MTIRVPLMAVLMTSVGVAVRRPARPRWKPASFVRRFAADEQCLA